ncbi:2Fe-2S iron-sulfur cluster-binding protein [Piscinibacter sakaiensis]|uniref:2Fe-2S iron-sulfur cluster-binding protein n=1 Tax=Piscinibacter sakaiensis TaxID=1547922 RepID=UPI003AAA797F
MSNRADQPCFVLDQQAVSFEEGETLLAAANRAGHHIPHLCWHPRLGQSGACRLCTVKVDGRLVAACTTRATPDAQVENRSAELDGKRRMLLQMLFVEGNHFCPGCEKSGDCLLQATAYEMGMTGPKFEEFYPLRPVDASHPDMWLELNRCILCKLCVRASHEVDGKDVFAIGGHGVGVQLLVNSASGKLGDSSFSAGDFAASVCPVGAILPKRRGFAVPIGERRFDRAPISEQGEQRDGGSDDDGD